jgi:hypothetical protein
MTPSKKETKLYDTQPMNRHVNSKPILALFGGAIVGCNQHISTVLGKDLRQVMCLLG